MPTSIYKYNTKSQIWTFKKLLNFTFQKNFELKFKITYLYKKLLFLNSQNHKLRKYSGKISK